MSQHIRIASATIAPGPCRPAGAGSRHRPVERLIRAGQQLFHQGDAAPFLFELKSGVLRQTRALETGERQVTGFHFPGDLVGFAPQGIHRADCTAITEGWAMIHRADALTLAARDPALHDHLVQAALAEIARAQDRLVMLGRRTALAKLEAFLQFLIARTGNQHDGGLSVDIPMSRYDIADFLGLAVETVSRTFTELRNAGVISLEGAHRLTVLRPAALTRAD